jgi:hypothetical protein
MTSQYRPQRTAEDAELLMAAVAALVAVLIALRLLRRQ